MINQTGHREYIPPGDADLNAFFGRVVGVGNYYRLTEQGQDLYVKVKRDQRGLYVLPVSGVPRGKKYLTVDRYDLQGNGLKWTRVPRSKGVLGIAAGGWLIWLFATGGTLETSFFPIAGTIVALAYFVMMNNGQDPEDRAASEQREQQYQQWLASPQGQLWQMHLQQAYFQQQQLAMTDQIMRDTHWNRKVNQFGPQGAWWSTPLDGQ